jgi:putative glutamine amidotransferase|tara:strand:- start:4698 stop:5285 length:588 start_codon:yes stop_codon:yes gene_type:complete
MKYIGITQRETYANNESYDSLDVRWLNFLLKCNLLPVLLPNNIEITEKILKKINFGGFIFTGGGKIRCISGNESREIIEDRVLEICVESNLPLVGVCRGMQKIQDYFGISIYKVERHIMQDQDILIHNKSIKKNSFHNYGTKDNNDNFHVWAKSYDDVIKGIHHNKYNISAIMWHPERLEPFHDDDISFFSNKFL